MITKRVWDRVADILYTEYNLDINVLKREERHIVKDFEEELLRIDNMKLIFPCQNYDQYKN